MKYSLPRLAFLLILVCISCFVPACSKAKPEPTPEPAPKEVKSLPGCPVPVKTKDAISKERTDFRARTRTLYNQRRFADLEALATELRTSKAVFGNGGWKIMQFYDCLECRDSEPESMWQLHDQIHKDWIAAYPESITARVAYAGFLTDYAWQARGTGYSETVTENGWRLFKERLVAAREVLDDSAALRPQCPMWWRFRMTVALGQNWSPQEFSKLYDEAKAFEPEFWGYDVAKAHFLMPRWHGAPGEWEYVAETDAQKPEGLGWEAYARVVINQSNYESNIFRETKASWSGTRAGCERLREKYPDSLEILNSFCDLACQAGDRALAKQLFQELNGRMDLSTWNKTEVFIENQNWAYGGSEVAE